MKLGLLAVDCNDCYKEIEISSLESDSRQAIEGSLFFCINGTKEDGHLYAADAIMAGSVALVVSRKLNIDIPQIVVGDTRSAMAKAAVAFYSSPATHMKLIGITGTNGKTTSTYILKSILEESGRSVGIIGTTAIIFDGRQYPSSLTTPDPVELNRILRQMLDSGVDSVIMEVSAHALALNKTDGIIYDVAGFTNLSRDHLDFFGDMNSYAEAKLKLFTPERARAAVTNMDDELGRRIASEGKLPTMGYGCENPADAFAIDLNMSAEGLTYVLNINDDIGEVKFSLPGRFNMYNTLCAATIAKTLGVSLKDIISGIKKLKKVDGRFNIFNTGRFSVIIDFAHTDDGLTNILNTIREFADNQIITVFGCGGNRDKTKRPIMGRVVSQLSDFCIVTSDNPRYENPDDIIAEVVGGIKGIGKANYIAVTDRMEAIEAAFERAREGDIVLIAGKGAEKYQDALGIKHPYSDEQYVLKLIEENNL